MSTTENTAIDPFPGRQGAEGGAAALSARDISPIALAPLERPRHHVPWSVTLRQGPTPRRHQHFWRRRRRRNSTHDPRSSQPSSNDDACGSFHPAHPLRLPNNLLFAVGFLEFFNALDFPANVWNQVPVPRFASALMITCGAVILLAMAIAAVDACRSFRNIRLLRRERAFLHQQLDLLSHHTSSDHNNNDDDDEYASSRRHMLKAWLSVNLRELGWEVFDRFVNDSVLGFAGVLVGAGTVLAIGGAHPRIFLASNLLSGWIGNGFMALYGAVNSVWSLYLWARAGRHRAAVLAHLQGRPLARRARGVFRAHRMYAAANGLNLLLSGSASLLCAQFWWGYVLLVPCILVSVFCNAFWRRRVAYERVVFPFRPLPNGADVEEQLAGAVAAQQRLGELASARGGEGGLEAAFRQMEGVGELLDWVVEYEVFPELCVALAQHVPAAAQALGVRQVGEFTVAEDDVRKLDPGVLLPAGAACAARWAPIRMRYKERMLYELLGSYLCIAEDSEQGQDGEGVSVACGTPQGAASEKSSPAGEMAGSTLASSETEAKQTSGTGTGSSSGETTACPEPGPLETRADRVGGDNDEDEGGGEQGREQEHG